MELMVEKHSEYERFSSDEEDNQILESRFDSHRDNISHEVQTLTQRREEAAVKLQANNSIAIVNHRFLELCI